MFIDGVKIEVSSLNGSTWEHLAILQFRSVINERTGEVLALTKVAIYNGLKFYITKSREGENQYYYSVRGSLHKYFNNGVHNANNISYQDLKEVINDLHQRFNIDPETSTIHNLEFGVNIHTDISPKKIIQSLITWRNDAFYMLKIEGLTLGKKSPKQRYTLKIYDKGLQSKMNNTHILRIEIAVKKMSYLKGAGIVTLSDLLKTSSLQALGEILAREWQQVIYYDYGMRWRQMTQFEKTKALYYLRPSHWLDFNKFQRARAKKHFAQLMGKYCTSTTHQNIAVEIDKFNELLKADLCQPLTHDFENIAAHEMSTFDPLECTGQKLTFDIEKEQILKPEKTRKKNLIKSTRKERVCKCCKTDILHKRKTAIYCSKKCNNTINGIKRTQSRIIQRDTEKMELQKLLVNIKRTNYLLSINYRDTNIYTDTLFQYEILVSNSWLKTIVKVSVNARDNTSSPIVLNGYRAKSLIRIINNNNKVNHEKRK